MAEINNIKPSGQTELSSSRQTVVRDNQRAQGLETSVSASRSDTVSLTDTAEQLQSVQQLIEQAPTVDTERVASIRAAIADGSYSIDATQLAQNLLEFEFELR